MSEKFIEIPVKYRILVMKIENKRVTTQEHIKVGEEPEVEECWEGNVKKQKVTGRSKTLYKYQDVEKEITTEETVLSQIVGKLDLHAVIKAVNGL